MKKNKFNNKYFNVAKKVFRRNEYKNKVKRSLLIYENSKYPLLFKACIAHLYLKYDVGEDIVISAETFKIPNSTFGELLQKLFENDLAVITDSYKVKYKKMKVCTIQLKEIL